MVIPRCVHVNKAPRPGVVLSELSIAAVRQKAESQGEEVNKDKDEFGKAAADVHGVKIRVADGQTAFEGNSTQDERGRQAEEAHCEAEKVAQSTAAESF